jgi:glycosyltransferase involved in cell wall biosynthesis
MKTDQTQNENSIINPVMPVISIVMATYNGGLYLEQQMESIVVQTYPNIEIIIVDDCSTDNTIEILQMFQQKYSNIKLFSNAANLGYIKNFEKGCSLASGEYIALCDQDDYWHSDKLKKMKAAIGDFPLVYCDSILCDEDLQPIGVNISDRVSCRDFDNCLQQAIFCRIYGHATLIKKSLIQHAIPFLDAIPHDWWLCYIATFHGGMKYIPEPLASYRQHSANIFGAAGGKSRKHNKFNKAEKKRLEMKKIRLRINAFYKLCPDDSIKEKEVLRMLVKTYQTFSLINNFQRMILFFNNYEQLLASKKRSVIRKFLFCIKMFVKIK